MWQLLALLLALCACAQGEELSVFLGIEGIAPPAVVAAIEREAEAQVRQAGIRISWHSLASVRSGEDYPAVAVVYLRGDCRALPVSESSSESAEQLGDTHLSGGHVLPFGDLRCEAVRRFISPDMRHVSETTRNQLLGRALGRVLAHELYHILCRSAGHGRKGLAGPSQSRAELLDIETRFAPEDRRLLAHR